MICATRCSDTSRKRKRCWIPCGSEAATLQGRTVRKVSFNSFEGLRVGGLYSLPAGAAGARLPGVLVVDHRKGIPVWGNEQPLEHNDWGRRAVLIVETLDRGSRALEQNLRSFSDDDPYHHMKRQAIVAGTGSSPLEHDHRDDGPLWNSLSPGNRFFLTSAVEQTSDGP